jgi:hypothetical protein
MSRRLTETSRAMYNALKRKGKVMGVLLVIAPENLSCSDPHTTSGLKCKRCYVAALGPTGRLQYERIHEVRKVVWGVGGNIKKKITQKLDTLSCRRHHHRHIDYLFAAAESDTFNRGDVGVVTAISESKVITID